MATCTGFIEPLNLECWLVNTFSETSTIFTFVAFIIISIMAARFKMPNYIFLSSLVLFAVIMSLYIGEEIYILAVLLSGLISFYLTTKIWKQ